MKFGVPWSHGRCWDFLKANWRMITSFCKRERVGLDLTAETGHSDYLQSVTPNRLVKNLSRKCFPTLRIAESPEDILALNEIIYSFP